MPGNYVPCRTREDGEVHLVPPGDPRRTLCGHPVEQTTRGEDERTPCRDCARRLLVLTFRAAAQLGGVDSIEVTLKP